MSAHKNVWRKLWRWLGLLVTTTDGSLEETETNVQTLNDGQEDDDDKEEERDVKDNTLHLKLISGGVVDLVTDASASTHSHIHVEHVTLGKNTCEHVTFMCHSSSMEKIKWHVNALDIGWVKVSGEGHWWRSVVKVSGDKQSLFCADCNL